MQPLPQNQCRRRWIASCLSLLVITGGCQAPVAEADDDAADRPTLKIDRGTIDLRLAGGLPVDHAAVKDWVTRAGTAITDFYGKYPVDRVVIHVDGADSGAVQDGLESNGERIEIKLGKDTKSSDLTADWMMTHEMFHLSQPSLDDAYTWMSEGMADYLEPVARVRIGQITPERFWKDLVEGMPQGLPQAGDGGLDHTHSWGRTYWGGSLFWLLADIRIREQTHNQKSVRDAAVAVLNAGGNGSQDWGIDQLLAAYDAGTGTKVFQTLHDEMGNKPVTTDLNALWKSLGVIYSEQFQTVKFDDAAPLAETRRKITLK